MGEELNTQFVGESEGLESVVPVRDRMQPEYYALEVERIFRRAWLPVASVADLPGADDFVVVDVPTLATSLIIARARDGRVRAFHNICRHRGNRLLDAGKGCRALFRCAFHGWNYSNDGRLVGVTDRAQFPGLDVSRLGLIPVATQEWEGYVFVNFDPEPRWNLAQWLGKMHGEYQGYFDGRRKIAEYRIRLQSNWHVAVNSFTEGYHSLFVHAKTLPDYQGGKANPNRRRAFLELLERNARYSARANPDHHQTHVEAMVYERGRALYPTFPPFEVENDAVPPGVNPGRDPLWAFDLVEFFPNLVILGGAHWHLNLWFWPIDHERTEGWVELFAYEPERVADHLAHAYCRTILREVYREDVAIMEGVTTALKSGVMRDIVLSRQEMLLQKHYASAARMVAEP